MSIKLMNEILDVLNSLDKRIIQLEHDAQIKNKYYNDGERLKISKIREEIRKLPK